MPLVRTNENALACMLAAAIRELKEAALGVSVRDYHKQYGTIQVDGAGEGETFRIVARIDRLGELTVVTQVAVATGNVGQIAEGVQDNSATRRAQQLCIEAGARTLFYGLSSTLPSHGAYIWFITMRWDV